MDVSERFLQTALDGIHDCISIVDKNFQIIFVNEAASRRAEKIGVPCWGISVMHNCGKKYAV